VLLGTATAFWLAGDSAYDDLEAACGARGCTEAELDDSGVSTLDTLTNLTLALGLGAAATAGVLLVVRTDPTGGEAQVALGPRMGVGW
jgi:hypothetical protein